MGRGWFASVSRLARVVLQLLQGTPGTSESASAITAITNDLGSLQRTWEEIELVLRDAEEREVREQSVMLWRQELRHLACEAEDLLESYQYEVTAREVARMESWRSASGRRKRKRGGGVDDDEEEEARIPSVPHPLAEESFRRRLADDIRRIRELYDEISRQREDLQLKEEDGEERFDVDRAEAEALRSDGSKAGDPCQVFGREDEIEELIQLLIGSASPMQRATNSAGNGLRRGDPREGLGAEAPVRSAVDREVVALVATGGDVEVVAVVGMGGVGKTTLCQLAFADMSVVNHFHVRGWVRAPVDFGAENRPGTIRMVVETLVGCCSWDCCDLASLQGMIEGALKGKRFLLVMDDVWNEDPALWQHFVRLVACGTCAPGSKILITTRSFQAASAAEAVWTKHLRGLSQEASWSMFMHYCAGNPIKQRLQEIGRGIVDKCRGLPLAIKVLGRMLRSYPAGRGGEFDDGDEEIWRRVLQSDLWDFTTTPDGKQILGPLLLSYLHLPANLRPCFRLCSLFPKSYPIDRKHLTMLWSAHGLLQVTQQGGLEEVGSMFIDHLLSASFFQAPNFLPGPQRGANRFVAMHDLVHDLAKSLSGDECHSFVGDGSGAGGADPVVPPSKPRHLSFFDSSADEVTRTIGALPIKEDGPHVRTLLLLDLVENAARGLAGSRNLLESLRVLSLEEFDGEELGPGFFSGMIHRRYLRLYMVREAVSLPEPIFTLYNLRSLDLSHSAGLVALPDSVGNMTRLRHLDLSYTGIRKLPDRICELSNLQDLNVIGTGIKELPELLGRMIGLQRLNLGNNTCLAKLPESIGQLRDLRTLRLPFTDVQELPSSTCDLCRLEELDMMNCLRMRELPRGIGSMINLRVLESYAAPVPYMAKGFGRLTKLQSLSTFHVGADSGSTSRSSGSSESTAAAAAASISELKGMVHLQGKLLISGLGNVSNEEQAIEATLSNKTHLEHLELQWGRRDCWHKGGSVLPPEKEALEEDEERQQVAQEEEESGSAISTQERVLESLWPPNNLRQLCLSKYGGRQLPTWLCGHSVDGQLPCRFLKLNDLQICGCYNLTCLHPLPLPSSLNKLELNACRSLTSVPLCNLLNLESLTILNCRSLERLDFGLAAPPQCLAEDGCRQECCLTLKAMTIRFCSRLHFPLHTRLPPSLEDVYVEGCRRLSFSQLDEIPPILDRLHVKNCPSLVEWCHKHRTSKLGHVLWIWLDDASFMPEEDHVKQSRSSVVYPFYTLPIL